MLKQFYKNYYIVHHMVYGYVTFYFWNEIWVGMDWKHENFFHFHMWINGIFLAFQYIIKKKIHIFFWRISGPFLIFLYIISKTTNLFWGAFQIGFGRLSRSMEQYTPLCHTTYALMQGWGAGRSRVFLAPWSRSRLKKTGAGAAWKKVRSRSR